MKIAIGLLIATLIAATGFGWAVLHWTYSDGYRAGYVQKLSREGISCKTWEGEMSLVTAPGTTAGKFRFTVPSDDVATRLALASGKLVALHYQQHKLVMNSCFGSTQYFVTDVRLVH